MEEINITAEKRSTTGKGAAKRLRREGRLPAILYGAGIKENEMLSLNEKELNMILHHGAGGNLLVNLNIDKAKKKRTVMFKEVLRNPVLDNLLHVDLVEVSMDKLVTVAVPLHITGKAKGVVEGGILQQDLREVNIECLPSNIPSSIDVDVTELTMGDSLHVSDIILPEGAKITDDLEHTVISVVVPVAEEEVKTAEEIEGELAESFADKDKPAEGEGEATGEGEGKGEGK